MIFFLVKIASVLVYPTGFAFFLLVLGFGLWNWGRSHALQVWGKRSAIAGIVVLYIFSNGFVAEQLARSLERQQMPPDPMSHADGVIVLGGGITPRAFPRRTAEVGEAGDRLLYAAHLLRTGLADWMVYSAAGRDLSYSLDTEAQATQQILEGLAVDKDRIIVDEGSRNTKENAARSLPIAIEKQAKSVFLVTSASHMPRSIAIFRKEATALGAESLQVIPAPCDFAFIDPEKYPPWYYQLAIWLLPTSGALDTSTRMIHEYYGMVYYWLRGWI
jgi:uncharacterized SAM-binding protein YcdF (DUF218 family)